ncbi:MAG: fibronectin type III domain-containing protein [Flavobacteriaceae bacterium]
MKAISFLIIIMIVFSCNKKDENCEQTKITGSTIFDENNTMIWFLSGEYEDEFKIEYGARNFELGEGTLVYTQNTINFPNISLGKLIQTNPNTEYDVYVQKICNENTSNHVGPYKFKSPEKGTGCYQPSSFQAIEVTSTTVLVDWGSSENATSWSLSYEDEYGNQYDLSVYEKPYLITDLSPVTNYTFKLTAHCDSAINPYSLRSEIEVTTLN